MAIVAKSRTSPSGPTHPPPNLETPPGGDRDGITNEPDGRIHLRLQGPGPAPPLRATPSHTLAWSGPDRKAANFRALLGSKKSARQPRSVLARVPATLERRPPNALGECSHSILRRKPRSMPTPVQGSPRSPTASGCKLACWSSPASRTGSELAPLRLAMETRPPPPLRRPRRERRSQHHPPRARTRTPRP